MSGSWRFSVDFGSSHTAAALRAPDGLIRALNFDVIYFSDLRLWSA